MAFAISGFIPKILFIHILSLQVLTDIATIIFPIIHMCKLKHREIRTLVQCHIANTTEGLDFVSLLPLSINPASAMPHRFVPETLTEPLWFPRPQYPYDLDTSVFSLTHHILVDCFFIWNVCLIFICSANFCLFFTCLSLQGFTMQPHRINFPLINHAHL
jgi:hypothetical protein